MLKVLKQKPLARGYINLRGKLNTKDFKTDFIFSSPKITTATQNFQNIKLLVPDLQYKNKKITTSYKLGTTFLEKAFNFKGDISYKDTLLLSAKSNDFNGKSEFYLDDKTYRLIMKELNISELLSFASQKPYADGLINLNASGDFNKVNFKIDTDALVKEYKIKLKADGSYDINSKLLDSKFKASVPLEKDSFDINGNAKFKEYLSLEANSSSFESQSAIKIDDKYFKLEIDNINLEKLTKALKRPRPLFGLLDIDAKGTTQDIEFKLRSDDIQRSMEVKKIDNSLMLNLSGRYTPELLTLKDGFIMKYKKEHLPIKIDAAIQLKAPYNSKGSFLHNNDRIIINSFLMKMNKLRVIF